MSMKDKNDALSDNKTWESVPRPSNANVFKSFWTFQVQEEIF